MRLREFGATVGYLPTGRYNAITDVPGVSVGQVSVIEDNPTVRRSGVTVIFPHQGNLAWERVYAGTDVLNGYGVMVGRMTIDEWGLLGSPIVLTGTRSISSGIEAATQYLTKIDPKLGEFDLAIPVVAECDDGFLNDNRGPALPVEAFFQAFSAMSSGPVAEGSVGAGTGMQLFEFKGGIGTASRVVEEGGRPFTLGVLVNTNFGRRHQLIVRGRPIGLELETTTRIDREGSCIGVVATDAPLLPHQLSRLAKRMGLGLARTGSAANDSSGEIFLAFSTAMRFPRNRSLQEVGYIIDGQTSERIPLINRLFDAAIEATEEAVLNALLEATTVFGRDGHSLVAFEPNKFPHLFD